MDFEIIVAGIFIISIIISWIIAIPIGMAHFLAFILCIGKERCKKDDCCLRKFCNRTAWSDKENEIIRKKIEGLRD